MRGGGSERQVLHLLRHIDRKQFCLHLYLTERAGDLLNEVPDDVTVHSLVDANPAEGALQPLLFSGLGPSPEAGPRRPYCAGFELRTSSVQPRRAVSVRAHQTAQAALAAIHRGAHQNTGFLGHVVASLAVFVGIIFLFRLLARGRSGQIDG